MITSTIAFDSWQHMGGTGSISEYDGFLIVRHTTVVHAEIEELLEMLREAVEDRAKAAQAEAKQAGAGGRVHDDAVAELGLYSGHEARLPNQPVPKR